MLLIIPGLHLQSGQPFSSNSLPNSQYIAHSGGHGCGSGAIMCKILWLSPCGIIYFAILKYLEANWS